MKCQRCQREKKGRRAQCQQCGRMVCGKCKPRELGFRRYCVDCDDTRLIPGAIVRLRPDPVEGRTGIVVSVDRGSYIEVDWGRDRTYQHHAGNLERVMLPADVDSQRD